MSEEEKEKAPVEPFPDERRRACPVGQRGKNKVPSRACEY